MSDGSSTAAAAAVPSAEEAKALVDFRFYRTLWELQAIFSNPPSLSDQSTWKSLFAGLDTVLQAFEGSPLTEKDALASATGASRASFPKFLTSQRLINLQLRDPEFRRHVLLQSLILFQHLTQLKAPKDRFVPSKAQADTLKVYTERVEKVLRATPPNGAVFARDVKAGVLSREVNWIGWKETKPNACPPLERKRIDISQPLDLDAVVAAGAAATAAAEAQKTGGKVTLTSAAAATAARNAAKRKAAKRPKREIMGTTELARLWSNDDPNDEMLKDRNFTPALDDYVDQLLEEEGDSTIDSSSALKNDRRFTWRLLRLFQREDLNNFVKANGSLATVVTDLVKQRDEKKAGTSTSTNTSGAATPAAASAAAPPPTAPAAKPDTPKTPAVAPVPAPAPAPNAAVKPAPPAPVAVTPTSAAATSSPAVKAETAAKPGSPKKEDSHKRKREDGAMNDA